jgi:alkylation response protein AidB-like acyl-CoA dehydrogenase
MSDHRFVPHGGKPPVPARSAGELHARAAALLPEIAAGAATRERERELPFAWIRRIADAGLYTWRVPVEHGGPGGRIRDVIRFIVDLAAADSNIAQSMRPAFGFVEGLLFDGRPESLQRWLPLVLQGQVFGNAGWERGGPNGQILATLKREGATLRANGTKFYSTGSLYADWVSTFALDDDGVETAFTIPRERAGLQLRDDFDAMGQRLTASGTTIYANVEVKPDEVRPALPRDRRTPVPALYQLYLAALEAGIAKNALADATTFAREHARPIRHSSAAKSVDDPYVRESVGEIATQAYAAEAVVLRAADAVDAAWDDGLSHAALTRASVEVAQAQVFAAQAALRACERVFDVGSASATLRTHNLDRHWRNARTVANHNPRQWKAAAVGTWWLVGEEPPTSGLF